MRRILLATLVALSTLAPATAEVRIKSSPGGQIGEFLDMYAEVKDSGQKVVIDGPCLSACTVLLGTIPKDVNGIYASLWAPDAALIAKQLPDVGLDVRMIGPDGQFEPVDYIQASAGGAEGNYVTFFVPDMKKIPAAVEFVKAFEAKYGTLSSYGPLAYESTNIILEAIKKVGKPDRGAIRDAVRATKGYQGILGQNIAFDDKGDVATPTLYVYQVKGTGFELVKPVIRE